MDEMVLSLSAKGLARGEMSAHPAEAHGAGAEQTITTITDRLMEDMAEWQSRPFDGVCPMVFTEASARRDSAGSLVLVREGMESGRWLWCGEPRPVPGR